MHSVSFSIETTLNPILHHSFVHLRHLKSRSVSIRVSGNSTDLLDRPSSCLESKNLDRYQAVPVEIKLFLFTRLLPQFFHPTPHRVPCSVMYKVVSAVRPGPKLSGAENDQLQTRALPYFVGWPRRPDLASSSKDDYDQFKEVIKVALSLSHCKDLTK